jgi:hypothetical protein
MSWFHLPVTSIIFKGLLVKYFYFRWMESCISLIAVALFRVKMILYLGNYSGFGKPENKVFIYFFSLPPARNVVFTAVVRA